MSIFKKVTSTVGVIAIAVSSVSASLTVQAASVFTPYADALATAGIIGTQTTEAGYRLGDTITRAEMAKIAVGIKGAAVTEATGKVFSDVTSALGDLAKYIEAAANAGLVSKTNAKFRPLDLVTRAEMVKMLLNAKGIAPTTVDAGFKDIANTGDLAGFINAAAQAGIIKAGASFNPNNTATRGEGFKVAANSAGLTTSAVEAGDDLDLGDLFGDTTNTGATVSTGTTSTGVVAPTAAGTLEVSLSPTSPVAVSLPDSAEGVTVAKFDLSAGAADITVSSVKLTRKGLGATDAVDTVALFANDGRLSKARTFNSTDDTADVALSPALVIKAGSTVTLVAKVNTKDVSSTQKFAVELTSLTSSAASVKGGAILASQFEVQNTAATIITLSNDGTVTTPKLGAIQAEVLKFKVKNDTTSAEDVTFSEITLKEDGTIDENTELANVALYYNGAEVAKVASMASKYVTFKLTTPVVIKDGKTEKFVVKADIVGGAADTINFTLDNDLDVTASASKYGYVTVAGSVNTTALTVEAGEVTLSAIDPTVTDVREDKDDVILGKVKVVTKGALELSKVKFTVTSVAGNINNALENFELYDETNGVKYDLTATADNNHVLLTEDDLSVVINKDTTFVVRADTKASITAFDGFDFRLSMTLDTNSDSAITATDVGFVLKEMNDDELVTDVTPSTLTWKTISGQESSAAVSTIVMSDSTSVVGSKGIEVAQFQVSADDSSALNFTEAKVHLAVATLADAAREVATLTIADAATWLATETVTATVDGTAVTYTATADDVAGNAAADATALATKLAAAINANATAAAKVTATSALNVVTVTYLKKADVSTTASETSAAGASTITVNPTTNGVGSNVTSAQVAAAYLYNGTTLLDQVSGSQLASGVATFDGFNQTIAKNGKVTYTVKIDLVDDVNQATKRISASLQSIDVEDEDSDDVVATGTPGHSARDLTISGVGTLVISVDNTDTETDKVKNVIANGTSPFVASFELTATNEAIKVKDLQVVATDTGDDFVNSVSEVVLYKNDKTTEIARQPVTSDTVAFDNVNYVVAEGNTNIYVKLVTRKIGKDSAGVQTADITLKVQATDVEGNASGKAVTAGNGVAAATSVSLAFAVVPVKVSAISFVSSFGGETVASTLTNGENTVGIIAVTTDSSTNTKTDGTSLKTELESMALTVNTDAPWDGLADTAAADFTNITVKKINGTVSAKTVTKKADGTTALVEEAAPTAMNIIAGVDLGADEELENGTTTYYVVKATFSGLGSTANKYFQLKLDTLDTGSTVVYSSTQLDDLSDESAPQADNITSLRIGTTSVTGPSISSNY